MNLIDRLLRLRMAEHARETIAIARNSSMQMHRAWIFAFDHNYCQPHRVGSTSRATRAHRYGVCAQVIRRTKRQFLSRRFDLAGIPLPQSIERTWRASLITPPVRWRVGQSRSGPIIPSYALRDLQRSLLHAP